MRCVLVKLPRQAVLLASRLRGTPYARVRVISWVRKGRGGWGAAQA
jgi:hypothetical protein